MSWEKLQKEIYFRDGSLRDIYVFNANRNDWQKWIKYVNENFLIEFFNGQTQKIENRIDENIVFAFWDGKTDLINDVTIKLGRIYIKCHFFVESEIENDLDPAEINSVENHNELLNYLIGVSSIIGKKLF